ncbi:hypothetical protein [Maribellus sp. YY47]|uniref:hypothetical protein n=1 Tax=Maribellus sp. YY47 TaxID=2929486 RepID=UPI002000705B|nr:hypothetical protein [Maribellus sp. YY47]MCK3685974.1 hypothetical protein [Maribellus sp. YY47]
MKTIKTENNEQEFVPGLKEDRDKFLNGMIEKAIMLLLLLLLLFCISRAEEQVKETKWQFDISTGIHAFYAPVENLKWDNPGLVTSVGLNRMLGQKKVFSVGLQFQYEQSQYLGNASSLQFIAQFLPVILRKIELGVGFGAGYRLSGYPTKTLSWDGDLWEKGKNFKGIFQIPLQFSVGFRSIRLAYFAVTPFIAYQLQALLGYNPDFDPLPDSTISCGFKFQLY